MADAIPDEGWLKPHGAACLGHALLSMTGTMTLAYVYVNLISSIPSDTQPRTLVSAGNLRTGIGIVWTFMWESLGLQESMSPRLLPSDRRHIIADLIRDRGGVRGSELVDLLGVTDETVRRDMSQLERTGVRQRNHGGASAPRPHDDTTTAVPA